MRAKCLNGHLHHLQATVFEAIEVNRTQKGLFVDIFLAGEAGEAVTSIPGLNIDSSING